MGQQIDWNTQIKNKPTFLLGSEVQNEIPTGSINSTDGSDGNGHFTLAHRPTTGTFTLHKNGILLREGVDFALSTQNIDYVLGKYPITGDWHVVNYRY
jgi:hypothetical protein